MQYRRYKVGYEKKMFVPFVGSNAYVGGGIFLQRN